MQLTKAQLIDLLTFAADRLRNDDSHEGLVRYTFGAQPGTFTVEGCVRYGNRDGQGCVRMIQRLPGERED